MEPGSSSGGSSGPSSRTSDRDSERGSSPALDLSGIFLPVTTPFGEDDGRADVEAFRANLRAWLATPISGIVVAGSTGEAPLLEDRELFLLVDAARREVSDDRVLVVGTGAESTRRTVALSREVAARGADAVMVRPPAYYAEAMTREALERHYLRVADASPVPVVLYHIPRYVPVDLKLDLVRALTRHENVAGIKDSSGDIRRAGETARSIEQRAAVLVGNASILYGALEVGATGGVLAVGCLATEECCRLVEAVAAGDGERAGALQERITPLNRAVVGRHGAPGVKYALDRLGLVGGPPRPPLLPLDEEERRRVDGALRTAGIAGPRGAPPEAAGDAAPPDAREEQAGAPAEPRTEPATDGEREPTARQAGARTEDG